MSNKTYLVAEREYTENLRTKAFWIGIFIFPIILVISIVVPRLLERTKDVRRYAIVDYSPNGEISKAAIERGTYPDIGKLYAKVRQLQLAGSDELADYPVEVRFAAPLLAKMSEEDARTAGSAVSESGQIDTQKKFEGLDEGELDKLKKYREPIRKWWQSLPAKDAQEFASNTDQSRYQLVDVPPGKDAEATLRSMVDRGEIFAYFVVGKDPEVSAADCKYFSNNLTDESLKSWFADNVNDEIRERRFRKLNISKEKSDEILAPVAFESFRVAEGGKTEAKVGAKDTAHQWAPVVFVYLLWISIFSISQMLLTNTIEEKSNRIIEVLLSSISPKQLMYGKIFGIAATGLTMIVSWIIFFFIAIKFGPALFGFKPSFDLSFLLADKIYLASFVAYFIAGYLLYAALYVGIGSVCNSLKEAQNLVGPVVMILMMPMLAMIPVGQDPNGALARFLSFIPPMTPFIMMNRTAGPPSTIDYIATTTLLAVSIWLAFRGAAKIFRIGVLMTGKPPRFREIFQWLRAPIGVVPSRESVEESTNSATKR